MTIFTDLKRSLRAYGSKSIKHETDIGNRNRQMLPENEELDSHKFYKCIIQAYDITKIGCIITQHPILYF